MLCAKFNLVEIFGNTYKTEQKIIKLKASDPRDVNTYVTRICKRLLKAQCLDKMKIIFNPRKLMGYSKPREGISSDHRVLCAKFNLVEIFGNTYKTEQKIIKLKASDPRDVNTYVTRICKRLLKAQCLDKMKIIFNPRKLIHSITLASI